MIQEIRDGDPVVAELLELYENTFPVECREPTEQLLQELRGEYRIPFRFFVAMQQGNFAGFIRWAHLPVSELGFVVHLAVERRYRRFGFGRALMEAVREACPAVPIVFETEDDRGQDGSVLDWYLRMGAHVVSQGYNQPELHAGLGAVPLMLMAWGPVHDPRKLIQDFYQEVWELPETHPYVQKAWLGVVP
jgi:GNAT superfamily N-acetyltransferase